MFYLIVILVAGTAILGCGQAGPKTTAPLQEDPLAKARRELYEELNVKDEKIPDTQKNKLPAVLPLPLKLPGPDTDLFQETEIKN